MAKHLACLQKWLESAFYIYGKFVARHPLPFLIVPFVITCLAAVGLIYLPHLMVDDPEYLYTQINGDAKKEREIFQQVFNTGNRSDLFLPTRKTDMNGFLNVIVTSKYKDGNILTDKCMKSIILLDAKIKDLKLNDTSFYDICGRWKSSCLESNTVLWIVKSAENQSVENINISYPSHNGIHFIANQIGGVVLNENTSYITSAKALLLTYFLNSEKAGGDRSKSDQWVSLVKDFLLNFKDDAELTVDFQTYLSNEEELGKSLEGIIPRFALTVLILLSFCVISCAMTDWVRSKVWVALAGQLAAGMAIVSSLGILCVSQMPFATSVGVMPFLIIGIGIDDLFVMLSSWRHTSYTLPVEERMGHMMKTAAISITVTSVTDALAFCVGSLSVFRIVTLFCVYTGVAVIFSYFYAITFLAACFALSGEREAMNDHDIACVQVLPRDTAGEKSTMYRLFCAGGDTIEVDTLCSGGEIGKVRQDRYYLPLSTKLLGKYFAPFLMKKWVKIATLLLYVVYLTLAVMGCLVLEKGLKLQYLAPVSSYLRSFFDHYEKYFTSEYGYQIMIAFTGALDYSNQTVRNEITSQLQKFKNTEYFYEDEAYTESWLRTFEYFLNSTNQYHIGNSNMTSFIDVLRNQFLTQSQFEVFHLDVAFNRNYSEIVGSRFLLQATGFKDTTYLEPLMTASRKMAAESKFNITIYHPEFVFYDPYVVIINKTLQNLGIAVGSMLIVSILLLPSLVSAIFVTLSVVSMSTGVIGYMAFWDVHLDTVSMINLLMCIGFSVDFSAHISYHISISQANVQNTNVILAIGHIGTPVLQGALSTILGVLVLATSESYLFLCFFKVMFLVMVIGVLHALFFLPVALSVVPQHLHCACSPTSERELKSLQLQNQLAFENTVVDNFKDVHRNGDAKPL